MKHSEINWPKLIDLGLKLVGTPYVFGAEVNLKDPDISHIKAIDCSELIEYLFAQIGIQVPDGSYNQAKVCRKIQAGEILIGDLIFLWNPENEVIHHVGINLGEGRILEAKGKAYGVVITPIPRLLHSSHFAFFGRLKQIEDA